MARQAKVVISSVNNVGPGVKAAAKDLVSFESNVVRVGKALQTALSAGAVTAFAAKVTQFGVESVKAFGEVERKMIQLKTALGGNEQSFERMTDLIADLSRQTLRSKGDIQDLVADLAALGKSDEDINRIATAAVNLSNVTGQGLNEAMKQINATFSGSTDELGKLIPEIKGLTKEQLAAGGAADIVNEKLASLSKEMSEGISQRMKNLNDAWGDFTETIGEKLAPAMDAALQKLTDTLDKMGRAIRKFSGEQTVEDRLAELADQIAQRQAQLKLLQAEAARLTARGVAGVAIQNLLDEIQRTQGEIRQLENSVSGIMRAQGGSGASRTVTAAPAGGGGPATTASDGTAAAIKEISDAALEAETAFQGWNYEATAVAGAMTPLLETPSILEASWTTALENVANKQKDWGDFIADSMGTMMGAMGSALEAVGAALFNQEDAWDSFSAVAVQALAEVLRALGGQLAAMAAFYALTLQWGKAALAAAASAAAFVAAGVAGAWAASLSGGGGSGASSPTAPAGGGGGGGGVAAQYTGAQAVTFNFYNQGNVVGAGGMEELAAIIDSLIKRNARYA